MAAPTSDQTQAALARVDQLFANNKSVPLTCDLKETTDYPPREFQKTYQAPPTLQYFLSSGSLPPGVLISASPSIFVPLGYSSLSLSLSLSRARAR